MALPPRPEPPAARRGWELPAAFGAGVVFTLVVGGLIALGVSRRAAPPATVPDDQAAALATLAESHDAVPTVDDKGRVSKLQLEGAHVTDGSLDDIGKFTALRHLSLQGASVTDAGIGKLRDLRRLEALGITDTQVTDQGLATLAKIPGSLRYVWVTTNARLTPAGVTALRRALPGITVYVMNEPKPAAPPTARTPPATGRTP